ncbi:hypothetical protein MXB_928 [Myxobolus squamalis]|nr:hypothetical protein MXB_928 [Myxobolus squamalis]
MVWELNPLKILSISFH